jgi:hypothetical protein
MEVLVLMVGMRRLGLESVRRMRPLPRRPGQQKLEKRQKRFLMPSCTVTRTSPFSTGPRILRNWSKKPSA